MKIESSLSFRQTFSEKRLFDSCTRPTLLKHEERGNFPVFTHREEKNFTTKRKWRRKFYCTHGWKWDEVGAHLIPFKNSFTFVSTHSSHLRTSHINLGRKKSTQCYTRCISIIFCYFNINLKEYLWWEKTNFKINKKSIQIFTLIKSLHQTLKIDSILLFHGIIKFMILSNTKQ